MTCTTDDVGLQGVEGVEQRWRMVLARPLLYRNGECVVESLNLAHPVNREDDGKIRWMTYRPTVYLRFDEARIAECLAHPRRPERSSGRSERAKRASAGCSDWLRLLQVASGWQPFLHLPPSLCAFQTLACLQAIGYPQSISLDRYQ